MAGNATLSQAAKAARLEYMREYRKQNRERIREYSKRWNAEHPSAQKEYQRRYWERRAKAAQETTDTKSDIIN